MFKILKKKLQMTERLVMCQNLKHAIKTGLFWTGETLYSRSTGPLYSFMTLFCDVPQNVFIQAPHGPKYPELWSS